MDIRNLETLIAVVDSASLAEASRRLGVTPAAVAQRITALEGDIGTKLVTRVGRNVQPTPHGLSIAERCRMIVVEARNLSSFDEEGSPVGQLHIGAITTALTGILPQILRRLTEVAPRLDLFLSPGTSPNLYSQVNSGELDVAITVKPPFPIPKACEWVALRQERLVLMKPEGLKGCDPLELLRYQPFIRYDRNSWGGRIADRYLRDQKIRPTDRFELDSLEAISVMVSTGLGVAIVPDWAPPWPAPLNIKKLDLPNAPFREIGMFWLRSTERTSAIEALLRAHKRSTQAKR